MRTKRRRQPLSYKRRQTKLKRLGWLPKGNSPNRLPPRKHWLKLKLGTLKRLKSRHSRRNWPKKSKKLKKLPLEQKRRGLRLKRPPRRPRGSRKSKRRLQRTLKGSGLSKRLPRHREFWSRNKPPKTNASDKKKQRELKQLPRKRRGSARKKKQTE